MTQEEYIQFLRMVRTQSQIDTISRESMRAIQGRYANTVTEMFNRLQNAPELARQGIDPRTFGRRIDQLILQSDLVEAITNDMANMTTAVGDIAYRDYNAMMSWDGKVRGYNEVVRAAAEIREQVLSETLGGKTLDKWVAEALTPDLRSSLEEMRMQGLGYQDMVARLGKEYSDYTEAELITLARSYNQTMATQAQTDVYKANSDIVKGVTWSSVLENGAFTTGTGTCPRCAALDGREYPTTESAPPCPLHPRCRCLLLPRTKTWRELGFDIDDMEDEYRPWTIRTEEAIDAGGQRGIEELWAPYVVDSDGNPIRNIGGYRHFSDFWEDQDETFQNAVVGIQRARLIREDHLRFGEIVDLRGGLIPIRSLGLSEDALYFARTGRYRDGGGGFTPPVPPSPAPVIPPSDRSVSEVMGGMDTLAEDVTKTPEFKRLEKAAEKAEADRIKQMNLVAKQGDDATREQLEKLSQLYTAEQNAYKQLVDFEKDQINAWIRPQAGGTINWSARSGKKRIEDAKGYWTEAFRDVENMFAPEILERMPPIGLHYRHGSRAHYKIGQEAIRMGDRATRTLVHEYGHHVEYMTPGLVDKMVKWRTSRLAPGEGQKRIYKGEYGYEDKFFRHYVGKTYRAGGKDYATEIVSMGVERMYHDPVGFYNEDRDYFELILKIMWDEKI